MHEIRAHRPYPERRHRRTIEVEVVGMAFYAFVECGWCGYHGCAAPFGDNCPRCDHPVQFEAPPKAAEPRLVNGERE